MHSAQRQPAPPVHWRAFASNGASPARPQSDNGVAGLLPCQEPSDVEHFSHTTHPYFFPSCLLRATCYALRANVLPLGAAMGVAER